MPTLTTIAAAETATFCLLNNERAKAGEPAFTRNALLDGTSVAHSLDMVLRHYFEHDTPAGVNSAQRIVASGYARTNQSWTLGENIAWGTYELSTPRTTVIAWMNSPQHRENILFARYRSIGVGIVPGAPQLSALGKPGATYTTDFGTLG